MKWLPFALLLAMAAAPATAAEAPQRPSSLGKGYLEAAAPPDSVGLSPAPPAAGSSAEARDIDGAKAALALRGSPRWTLATADAELFGPSAATAFSCAAGFDIGPASSPKLDKLMRRAIADLGLSTSVIKRTFQRPRPFMVNGQPTCTPNAEAVLRKDGSYPSGHSAIGYGWGLILAELVPSRANQIVARGRAFGDSRRICNVHWLSDIEEGRVAASAVVARLHAEPAFQKDLKAARAELRKLKAAPHNCDAEAAALAPK